MQLTDDQKQEVAHWIASGASLSDVQQRLDEKFGVRVTYMEARFLVDDLKLVPQEKVQPVEKKPVEPETTEVAPPTEAAPAMGGGVRVVMDEIVHPGALVSGKVSFSDGVTAEWSLDRTGRFSLVPSQEGYRPSPTDFAEFRKCLERELAKQGL